MNLNFGAQLRKLVSGLGSLPSRSSDKELYTGDPKLDQLLGRSELKPGEVFSIIKHHLDFERSMRGSEICGLTKGFLILLARAKTEALLTLDETVYIRKAAAAFYTRFMTEEHNPKERTVINDRVVDLSYHYLPAQGKGWSEIANVALEIEEVLRSKGNK